jgi:hypothetical protein
VLKDATLEFGDNVKVEIDALVRNCAINLGKGTELVVGRAGVLADCQIAGEGHVTVHGQFFERASPGIVDARTLTVSRQGALVASVQQPATRTRFAIEPGARLRLQILGAPGAPAAPVPQGGPAPAASPEKGAAP